eukprot:1160056-Pelagomonas_calceolata.AAC.5
MGCYPWSAGLALTLARNLVWQPMGICAAHASGQSMQIRTKAYKCSHTWHEFVQDWLSRTLLRAHQ